MADSPASSDAEEAGPGRIEQLKERYAALKTDALDRLETERSRRPSVRMAFDFYSRDQAFAGSLLAGGLSVKLFLWFLPFALSVVVLIGTLSDRLDQPSADLARNSGLSAALAGMVDEAVQASSSARWYLAILGIVLLLWGGIGVVKALRLTSRLAWRMSSVPPSNRLLGSLGLVGVVVAILAVQWLRNQLPEAPWYIDLLTLLIGVVIIGGIYVVVFARLPHPEDVPWTAMIPGAVLMTVGILIVRLVTIVYFADRLDSASDLYGGLGIAATFLLWLYVIARTLVAAVSLNATIWQRNEAASSDDEGTVLTQ
jgi:uncharacterized BrkB/YihY/UPF0761 family membrane protein